MKVNELIGQEVKIYPGDSYYKYGKILDMNDNGVLFEITSAQSESGYRCGDIVFIAYSNRLNFVKKS